MNRILPVKLASTVSVAHGRRMSFYLSKMQTIAKPINIFIVHQMGQFIIQCLCTYTLEHLHSRQLKIGVVDLELCVSMYVIHFNEIVIYL